MRTVRGLGLVASLALLSSLLAVPAIAAPAAAAPTAVTDGPLAVGGTGLPVTVVSGSPGLPVVRTLSTVVGTDFGFSPDGAQVAYVSTDGHDLRLANADGSGGRSLALSTAGEFSRPAWSADGTRIAVVQRHEPSPGADVWQLLVFHLDGALPVTVLDGASGDVYRDPVWAGSSLVLLRFAGRGLRAPQSLVVVPAVAGGALRTLCTGWTATPRPDPADPPTTGPGTCVAGAQTTVDRPDVSPDGLTVAFGALSESGDVGSEHQALYTVPVAGGTPVELTGRSGFAVAWSPTGSSLAVLADDGDGGVRASILTADGAGEIPLGPTGATVLQWLPLPPVAEEPGSENASGAVQAAATAPFDSGLEVVAGQQIAVQATGRATFGQVPPGACGTAPRTDPDGQRYLSTPAATPCGAALSASAPRPTIPVGRLLGRIGTSGALFDVGSASMSVAASSGRLFLLVNDHTPGDNSGHYLADITTSPPGRVSAQHAAPGQETGLEVVPGMLLTVTASGAAGYGAEGQSGCSGNPLTDPDGRRSIGSLTCLPKPGGGLLPSAPVGALVGRIGETGSWFLVGSSLSRSVSAAGPLLLAYNDDNHSDNSGHYAVQVTARTPHPALTPAPPPPPPADLRPVVSHVSAGVRLSNGTQVLTIKGQRLTGATTVYFGALASATSVPPPCRLLQGGALAPQSSPCAYAIRSVDLTRTPDVTLEALAPPGADLSKVVVVTPAGRSDTASSSNTLAACQNPSLTLASPYSGGVLTSVFGDGSSQVDARLSLTTCAGAPVAGEDVTFVVTWPARPGGSMVQKVFGPLRTTAAGFAHVVFPVNEAAGTLEVKVRTNTPDPATGQAYVRRAALTQKPWACQRVSLSLQDPTSRQVLTGLVADGVQQVRGQVNVSDCNGTPLADQPVTFAIQWPGGSKQSVGPVRTVVGGGAFVVFTTNRTVGTLQVTATTTAINPSGPLAGQPFSGTTYGYQSRAAAPAPQLWEVLPTSVRKGATVRLVGRALLPPDGVAVHFGTYTPSATCGSLCVRVNGTPGVTQDSLSVLVPAGLPGGMHDVWVTTADGTSHQVEMLMRTRYVALGDSFSSGEGAVLDGSKEGAASQFEDKTYLYNPDGKDVEGWNEDGSAAPYGNCHRSKEAYSQVLARKKELADLTLDFAACSGGIIKNMINLYGDGRLQYLQEQALQIAHVDEGTGLITVSAAGNDLGFAPILAYCAFSFDFHDCHEDFRGHWASNEGAEEMGDNNIYALYPRLVRLYAALRDQSRGAPVYVIGYPHLFNPKIGKFADGFSEAEKTWITKKQDLFSYVMKHAAYAAGVTFVDIGKRFDAHTFNSSDPWINNFQAATVGLEKYGRGQYPFHPNVPGHRDMAAALVAKGILDPTRGNPPRHLDEAPPFAVPDHWWTMDRLSAGGMAGCGAKPGCRPLTEASLGLNPVPMEPNGFIYYDGPRSKIPSGAIVDEAVAQRGRCKDGYNGPWRDKVGNTVYICGTSKVALLPPDRPVDFDAPAPYASYPGNAFLAQANNLPPGMLAIVRVHSDPVELGTGTVAPDGTLRMELRLPRDLEPGTHMLTLDGTDPQGKVVHRSLSVQVGLHPDDQVTSPGGETSVPPSAPTAVIATGGDRSATVRWSPSAGTSSPVTGYLVTPYPGGSTVLVPAGATSAVVPDLISGRQYTFTVTAESDAGSSPESQSSPAVTVSGERDPFLPTRPNTGAADAAADDSAPADPTGPQFPDFSTPTGQSAAASPSPTVAATAGPSPSPSPSPLPAVSVLPGQAGPPPCAAPRLTLPERVVDAQRPAFVTVRAEPGSLVRLRAYVRPSTTYRTVRTARVPDHGLVVFRLAPTGSTRLYAEQAGCVPVSSSQALRLRSAVSLTARASGPRTLVFTGRVWPVRPGQAVHVVRRTGTGDVLTARGTVGRDGRWTARRSFTGAGTHTFAATTGSDLVTGAGRSASRTAVVP